MIDLQEQCGRDGFVQIPGALSAGEIARLNCAFEQDFDRCAGDWVHFGDSFIQTVDVLARTEAFDFTIDNPAVMPLVNDILGGEVSFEEFSMILRKPVREAADHKAWHRDIVRDFSRRMEINAVSLIYYLTDVTGNDHCFSIIPGTHGPLVDMRPEDVRPGMEVDLVAPAGTALLFHARAIHAGKLKPESAERRTIHIYYSRTDLPRTSEWSSFPERLRGRPLFAKWNRTDVIDGTGRKPKDLDPSLPSAVLLREAQRRANR